MRGFDVTVRMCSNEARIDNFMKLINVNFYVSKYFPSKIIIIEIFNDVLISRCTHEPFKSVWELGLPKTEIKVNKHFQ